MLEYGQLKKMEVKDAYFKYGFKQQGVFALEKIKKGKIVSLAHIICIMVIKIVGEAIFRCNPDTCDYLPVDKANKGFTREELLSLCKQDEKLKEFIHRYHYMCEDDKYDIPSGWHEQRLTEMCMFFNHSCEGTCGFGGNDTGTMIAISDIEPGLL